MDFLTEVDVSSLERIAQMPIYLWGVPVVGVEGLLLMNQHFGGTGPYDTVMLYEPAAVAGMLMPNNSVT